MLHSWKVDQANTEMQVLCELNSPRARERTQKVNGKTRQCKEFLKENVLSSLVPQFSLFSAFLIRIGDPG